jgi:hypothetical protein
MHRNDIIDTFERIEESGGGIDKTDTWETLNQTVKALNMDRKDVIRVMLDHWASQEAR